MLSSELPFQPSDDQYNRDGAPQDLKPGGRSSTAGAHTPRGQWESGGMERMGFDLRAGERLTSSCEKHCRLPDVWRGRRDLSWYTAEPGSGS